MVHMRDGEIPVASDERVDFIQDFTLKALRVKPDKWARMMISDEQRTFINAFIERNKPQVGLDLNFPAANNESFVIPGIGD